ncbi:uncharacterized protein LOC100836137 isoform X1 [Brachypodium distachyon]|uniref:Uncharacterized protein n=1 Tax=Brachypodium distachyon TaxID=15368 RepID=I1HMC2_BRADI|nr:uncharacterized protein LOC100836137 isoform X1 [Brachypodium distachyon]KQK07737.1 hypothetical protein BRADI_2g37370v3 [Brachypodium distachyon]|eukprot:XP_003566621.1 uncharacterized protein LOC100836137 isoform X1 [Brachypodium distachyon]
MAMEPLPLGFGDAAMDASLFSSLWSFQDELQPQESVEELRQSLLAATLELEAAKEELRRKEQSIGKLADLVGHVTKERDEARDHLQSLQVAAAAAAKLPSPPAPAAAAAMVTSSLTADSDGSLVSSSPVDPFFLDAVTSSDRRPSPKQHNPLPQQRQQQGVGAAMDAVLELLAAKKPLPPKGRLLQSVMAAGPLLQNLLVAGPLPRWRNPPPVHALDSLPAGVVHGGAIGAAGGAYGGNAMGGYAPNANNACMKRPAMAMAAAAPGFVVGKRHRLH